MVGEPEKELIVSEGFEGQVLSAKLQSTNDRDLRIEDAKTIVRVKDVVWACKEINAGLFESLDSLLIAVFLVGSHGATEPRVVLRVKRRSISAWQKSSADRPNSQQRRLQRYRASPALAQQCVPVMMG